MRVVHGGADGLEQLETGRDVQAERIAIGIDRCAVDVLHDDVSGLVRQRAAVEEVRDIGMVELRQDLPLDLEPRRCAAPDRAAVHDFDRDLLLELGIGALREVDFAHAARPQGAQHAVRSDASTRHAGSMLESKQRGKRLCRTEMVPINRKVRVRARARVPARARVRGRQRLGLRIARGQGVARRSHTGQQQQAAAGASSGRRARWAG